MGNIKSCKMHDLLHDLAQFLTQTDCSIMYVNQIPEATVSLRRICLFTNQNELSTFPNTLSVERKKLRAFFCTPPRFVDNAYAVRQIFKNFSRLRVLDLSYYPNNELPSSIAGLEYLRYLNLSNSQLTVLPDSITTLYNLQILILKNCFKLIYLPPDMRKLKNLRYLICKNGKRVLGKCYDLKEEDLPPGRLKEIEDIIWEKGTDRIAPMPSKVRELMNLQYLPLFSIGIKNYGFGIEELSTLNLLGRKLHIYNLENVSTRNEAEGARIGGKQHILWLELHWTKPGSCARDDLEVLEGLHPHRNLKKLGVYNYVSLNFSTWMMNLNNLLPNLVNIVLENCSKCEELPPLGLLPFLKVLKIKGLQALKRIGREFFVGNSSSDISFPYLEDLSILDMDNLEEWNDHISDSLSSCSTSSCSSSFPLLQKLKVKFCPKLIIMPTRISSIKELKIEHCISTDEAISSMVNSNITSLTSVCIKGSDKLRFLPSGLIEGNFSLENLIVETCYKFKGFNVDHYLMEEETVEDCNIVQDSEEEVEDVQGFNIVHDRGEAEEKETALTSLTLSFCFHLSSWPNISRFNYLVHLNLEDCSSQKSLPSGIENLPRLQFLTLGEFSYDLDSFPFPAANTKEERVVGVYFPSLVSLTIKGWYYLEYLPDQIQYIASLETLYIICFYSLEVLPEWLGNMASLKELKLYQCDNLEYMPSEEQMLRLTSLQLLQIQRCRLLADECREGGIEHYKISNIPTVYIGPDQSSVEDDDEEISPEDDDEE